MQQIRPFADERLASFCAYCGQPPTTRDHVPPRIFMDMPYPDNTPVVQSCRDCNEGASLDELYVACLIEVAICGTVDPSRLRRKKVASSIRKRPALAARLAASLRPDFGLQLSDDDVRRISGVLEKVARGLWTYETSESAGWASAEIWWDVLKVLTESQAQAFYSLEPQQLLPEVGSRMLSRVVISDNGQAAAGWIEVQPCHFSYAAELTPDGGRVKMIFADYLAAEVLLNDEGIAAGSS